MSEAEARLFQVMDKWPSATLSIRVYHGAPWDVTFYSPKKLQGLKIRLWDEEHFTADLKAAEERMGI